MFLRSRFRQNRPQLSCSRVGASVAAALALGTLMALSPTPPRAQDTAAGETVSLSLSEQPVGTALKLLFSGAGKNYSIDPAVQGVVSLNISQVSFGVALSTLLRAASPPLQSDLIDNVYRIKLKPSVVAPLDPGTGAGLAATPQPARVGVRAYRIPVDRYDASVIASMLGQAGATGSLIVVPPNYVGPGSGQGSTGGGQNGNGGGQNGNGQAGRGGGRGGRGGGQGGFGGVPGAS